MKWPDWLGELGPKTRTVVLTGAGVSAESGIDTFRGPDGIWESIDLDAVATPGGFRADPLGSWKWHADLWDCCQRARPNGAHQVLARLSDYFEEFSIITQNVDGLHQRAGSGQVLELHGDLRTYRCIDLPRNQPLVSWGGEHEPHGHPHSIPDDLWAKVHREKFEFPTCSCGALLRPDVVWFEEMLDLRVLRQAEEAVLASDLFLVVGTSGLVYPAAGLPGQARSAGSRLLEFNLAETELTPICDFSAFGPATRTLAEFEQHLRARPEGNT